MADISISSTRRQHAPDISGIKVVGYFSTNKDGKYRQNLSQLKYFKSPSNPDYVSFDLNLNYHLMRSKSHLNEKMDLLLNWCFENYDRIHGPKVPNSRETMPVDFICRRGVLKAILGTPYSNSEWIICAVKIHNTIYLCAMDTEDEILRDQNRMGRTRQISSWGLKFEQYVTSDSPRADPNPSMAINENEKFYCLFKSSFGEHSLLYASEMDCIDSKNSVGDTLIDKDVTFVELKTLGWKCLKRDGEVHEHHRFKLLTWWTQSYLTNTNKIVYGCKDDKGLVTKIKQYTLQQIVDMSRNAWIDGFCRNFLNDVLCSIKETVRKDYKECVYKFHRQPYMDRIKVEVLDLENSTEYSFLPQWYIDRVEMH